MVTRGVLLRGLVAVLIAVGSTTAAAAPCERGEADEIRALLTSQQATANTWNTAWRWIFTGAAVGTAVAGAVDPFPSLELKYGLYGSAGKATIGALARWIMPLRIHVPPPDADACTDLALLRKELARVAKKQRNLFWMGHIGGALVNLGGAAYVYHYDGLNKAMLSIAIGYPVGVLSNYTMPRGAWKYWRAREAQWTATVLPTTDGWLVGAAGTF